MKRAIIMLALIFFALPAWAGPCYTRENYVIAPTKRLFDTAFQMMIDKDFAAFDQMVKAGQAGLTKAGIKVFVVSRSWGDIEIRPAGHSVSLWTVKEAVSCP